MLACTRYRFTVAANSSVSPPPVQQRLFSGGLFPEDINGNLERFAKQHHLTRSVWIPLRAFDSALKPFGVFVLPSAALCDTSLTHGGASVGQTPFAHPVNRVLVNADQTSDPTLFDDFLSRLVPSPSALRWLARQEDDDEPEGGRGRGRRASEEPQLFDYPVNQAGELILDPSVARELSAYKARHRFVSNYWQRRSDARSGKRHLNYRNAEEEEFPGRFNPTYANGYAPVSLVGVRFRADLAQLMQLRVIQHGYVSRVWVSLAEAELFGTRLRAERVNDRPWVFYGGDSAEPVALYCTDQFEDSERLFPRPPEIVLARKGVWLPLEKLLGYPLLHKLCREAAEASAKEKGDMRGEAVAKRQPYAELADARVGADTTMHEARRHLRLLEEKATMSDIRLFGFRTREEEQRHLQENGLREALQEQAILKGFPTLHFISTRHLHLYGLHPRRGEVGAVRWPVPCHLWGNVFVDGEVWFNIAQLTNPWVALSFFYRRPLHFLMRHRLANYLVVRCCELQLRMHYSSSEWLPRCVVQSSGWRTRPGAPSIPFLSRTGFDKACCSADVLSSSLVNMDEVLLSAESVDFLRSYRPVDEKGRPYFRVMRMLTTLRAHEQGYTSPVWVSVYPNSSHTLKPLCEKGSAGHSDTRLTGKSHTISPLVSFRGISFANAEAVDMDPAVVQLPGVPLESRSPYSLAREALGEGVSAESFCAPLARDGPFYKEDSLHDADDDASANEDIFDTSDDVPIGEF